MPTTITGTVRNLRRGDSPGGHTGTEQQLTFRVELSNNLGDVQEYIPVEMRGVRLIGELAEGDKVELVAKRGSDGIARPNRLRNLTVGGDVRAETQPVVKAIKIVLATIIICIIIAGWAAVLLGFTGGF